MDTGTHLLVGVIAASSWPNLSTEQKIITVIFSVLPDSFEWLHQYARKINNGNEKLIAEDYNYLEDKINHWYVFPYNFLHNIFAPIIFLVISHLMHWPTVYGLMWIGHLLIDLPTHKNKLGLKLWWPFSQKRLHGFFDWWLLPFFKGWELWGYLALIGVVEAVIIYKFW